MYIERGSIVAVLLQPHQTIASNIRYEMKRRRKENAKEKKKQQPKILVNFHPSLCCWNEEIRNNLSILLCHMFGFRCHSICRLLLFSWIAKFNTKYTPYAKYTMHDRIKISSLALFIVFVIVQWKSILSSCIENQSEKANLYKYRSQWIVPLICIFRI